MAPSAEGAKEGSGLLGLCAAAAAARAKGAEAGARPEAGGGPEGLPFDFAELLEEGLGPGPASRHSQLPRRGERQHLLVQSSESGREHWLATEDGQPLLLARGSAEGTRYEVFAAEDPWPETLGPAFTLTSNAARDLWSLQSVRCERCEARGRRRPGSREVARMAHYREAVGKGQALCMDLQLPALDEEGESEVVCPACADSPEGGVLELTSRRPKWNAKYRSLTLDFGGRCSVASARNFQLEAPGEPGGVRLLFGKVGAHHFVLDYEHPLGAVQAFAAALSASHWK